MTKKLNQPISMNFIASQAIKRGFVIGIGRDGSVHSSLLKDMLDMLLKPTSLITLAHEFVTLGCAEEEVKTLAAAFHNAKNQLDAYVESLSKNNTRAGKQQ